MEENKTTQDSLWIEKNSRGYTYGVKVYLVPGFDSSDTLRERLAAHLKWLNDNYKETKEDIK